MPTPAESTLAGFCQADGFACIDTRRAEPVWLQRKVRLAADRRGASRLQNAVAALLAAAGCWAVSGVRGGLPAATRLARAGV